MTSRCAYCDNGDTEYGGTFAFEGVGVVEQPIVVDMCVNHWNEFYDTLAATGLLDGVVGDPVGNDGVTLGHVLRSEGALSRILNEAALLVNSIDEGDYGYEETLALRKALGGCMLCGVTG